MVKSDAAIKRIFNREGLPLSDRFQSSPLLYHDQDQPAAERAYLGIAMDPQKYNVTLTSCIIIGDDIGKTFRENDHETLKIQLPDGEDALPGDVAFILGDYLASRLPSGRRWFAALRKVVAGLYAAFQKDDLHCTEILSLRISETGPVIDVANIVGSDPVENRSAVSRAVIPVNSDAALAALHPVSSLLFSSLIHSLRPNLHVEKVLAESYSVIACPIASNNESHTSGLVMTLLVPGHCSIGQNPTIEQCVEGGVHIVSAALQGKSETVLQTAMEVIAAKVPMLFIDRAGLTVREQRKILAHARQNGSALFGPGDGGINFPLDNLGMGFWPDRPRVQNTSTYQNVIIISRGRMQSDTIVSCCHDLKINPVMQICLGDGPINGVTFADIIPLVSLNEVDKIICIGDGSGLMEEMLAAAMRKSPAKYSTPIVFMLTENSNTERKPLCVTEKILYQGESVLTIDQKKKVLREIGIPVADDIEALHQLL